MSQISTKFIQNSAVNLTTKVTGTLPVANGGTGQTTANAGFNAISPMTTQGDIIYGGTAGAATRLGIGSDGQVLKLASGIPSWANDSTGGGSLAYRSVTTTDTATNADDFLDLSGASFTETLFTAVGNSGKVVILKHNGTSLTQVYTLNTTSSQTIGGFASGAYALYTNGETLKLISNGANWVILEHRTETEWTTYTPTLGGFGTISALTALWKRRGSGLYVKAIFTAGTVAASAATISLPGSSTLDSAFLLPTQADYFGNITMSTVTGATMPTTARGPWFSYYNSSDATKVYFTDTVDSDDTFFTPKNGSGIANSNSKLLIKIEDAPIVGWKP